MTSLHKTAYFITILLFAMPARAVTINIDTDSADKSVFDGKIDNGTTELTITGRAPSALLRHITELAPQLKALDLGALSLTPAEIPAYSFTGSSIESAALPEALVSIGEGAFAGSAIKSIKLPAGLDSVSGYAFHQCIKLQSTELPHSLRIIGNNAFSGCTSMQLSGAFPEALERIGSQAMAGTGITTADMQNCKQLKHIDSFAFSSCKALVSAIMPHHPVTIGEGAFMNCTSLTSINAHIKTVPPLMLAAATAVESLSFMSESQTSQIGSYAFSGIKSVTSAELPEEIEYIGNNAMERMYGLTDIYATKLKSVPELGENVWASTLQKNISLHTTADMAVSFRNAEQWNQFNIVNSDESGIGQLNSEDTGTTVLRFDGNTLYITSGNNIERVTAHDINGQSVHDKRVTPSTNITINISEWKIPGAYIVRVYQQHLPATTHPVIINNR